MIKKRGSKFQLMTHDGKRAISKPTTKAKAQKQERAIQWRKHQAAAQRGRP